jgi:hypothetical protein
MFVLMVGLTLAVGSSASVVAVDGGYQVTYGINMAPGTSNASDITNVFIFESNGAQLGVAYGLTIPGTGVSSLTHLSSFAPTSALIAGIGQGIPGVGDGLDHIYMIFNDAYAESIVGLFWREVFPGSGGTRVRHSEFIDLLSEASAGDAAALAAVRNFATIDAAAGWFDPSGRFSVSEFSIVVPPVGGSIPEPATLGLLGLGLAGMAASRLRGR